MEGNGGVWLRGCSQKVYRGLLWLSQRTTRSMSARNPLVKLGLVASIFLSLIMMYFFFIYTGHLGFRRYDGNNLLQTNLKDPDISSVDEVIDHRPLNGPTTVKNKPSNNTLDKIAHMTLDDVEDEFQRDTSSYKTSLKITIATGFTLKDIATGDVLFRHCKNLEPEMKCSYHPFRPSIYNYSEAVLFRGSHLTGSDVIPSYRPPDQKWIFFETLPPSKSWNKYRLDLDIWTKFNITSTFTQDSSLSYTLYDFGCKENKDYKPSGLNYAAEKGNKTVVWLSTNCKSGSGHTESYRDAYIRELKKYISVDTDSSCGEGFKCGEYNPKRDACLRDVMSKYKFYLAFENCLCESYITQKVLKSVDVPVVPVVMGMADYAKILTPETFLDVQDFGSPKELAKKLHELDEHDKAYNRYIERKRMVTCRDRSKHSFHCQLCSYLHKNRYKEQTVPDVRTFWGVEQKCRTPQQFFKGISDELV